MMEDECGLTGMDDTLIDELRKIGSTGCRGATINPLARAALTAASGLRAPKPAEGPAEASRQVDLNSEDAIGDLEDANLQEHMARARRMLLSQQTVAAPSGARLQQVDVEVRQMMSGLLRGIKEQQMLLRLSGDDAALHALNSQKLAARSQGVHGYPSQDTRHAGHTPTMVDWYAACCAVLSSKLTALSAELAKASMASEGFERDLTILRRVYETNTDHLTQRSQRLDAQLETLRDVPQRWQDLEVNGKM